MAVPKYDELMKPLLTAVKDGEVYKIFEKAPVLVETEAESVISDDVNDADDTEVPETEEQEIIEVSKLQPKEIEDYVNSLKDMAKYWYDTYFPFESVNLTPEEQKRVDRLNRIGIGHFRPLITAIISRRDISANSRVKIFEAIERFIFVAFRFRECSERKVDGLGRGCILLWLSAFWDKEAALYEKSSVSWQAGNTG